MFIYRAPYPISKGGLKALIHTKLLEHTLTSGHEFILMNSFTIIHIITTQSLLLSFFHSLTHTKSEGNQITRRKPLMVSPVNRYSIQ